MAGVSFLCVASGPAERVRALLEVVRPHVDQIVVAFDGRGDPRAADWCADLADQRLWFPAASGFEHAAAWALDACTGDWVLRLDDDEVPSAALLDALPTLVRDRHVVDYAFTRRWLFPDACAYIDATPWREEHQRRLARNLPGLRPASSGLPHDQPILVGPRRILPLALYHLDTLVQSPARRLAKARDYERRHPAVFNAFPVNGMYLPEAIPDLRTSPVDAADVRSIERVLAGAAPPPPDAPVLGPVLTATPGELDGGLAGGRDDPVAGRLEVVAADAELPPAVTVWWEVDARNDGPGTWSWFEDAHPRVRVGSRFRDAAGTEVSAAWGTLTASVAPGEGSRVLVPLETPQAPGDYEVAVDLVVAGREWLDGGPRLPVRVTPDAPLARAAEAVRAQLAADSMPP
ncbi:MAG: hypothetical protein QOE86_311 [Solirubrobacteraceae bacterium]|nr:hypothetical protein [Solirubrobacteraceae bacterium]